MIRLVADCLNGLRGEALEDRVVDERRGQHHAAPVGAAHPEEPPPDEWLPRRKLHLPLFHGASMPFPSLVTHHQFRPASLPAARIPVMPVIWAPSTVKNLLPGAVVGVQDIVVADAPPTCLDAAYQLVDPNG